MPLCAAGNDELSFSDIARNMSLNLSVGPQRYVRIALDGQFLVFDEHKESELWQRTFME